MASESMILGYLLFYCHESFIIGLVILLLLFFFPCTCDSWHCRKAIREAVDFFFFLFFKYENRFRVKELFGLCIIERGLLSAKLCRFINPNYIIDWIGVNKIVYFGSS